MNVLETIDNPEEFMARFEPEFLIACASPITCAYWEKHALAGRWLIEPKRATRMQWAEASLELRRLRRLLPHCKEYIDLIYDFSEQVLAVPLRPCGEEVLVEVQPHAGQLKIP